MTLNNHKWLGYLFGVASLIVSVVEFAHPGSLFDNQKYTPAATFALLGLLLICVQHGLGYLTALAEKNGETLAGMSDKGTARIRSPGAAVQAMIGRIDEAKKDDMILQASLSLKFNRDSAKDSKINVYDEFDAAVARAVDRGVQFLYLVNFHDESRRRRVKQSFGKSSFECRVVSDSITHLDLPNLLIFDSEVFIGVHGPINERYFLRTWNPDLVTMHKEVFKNQWDKSSPYVPEATTSAR